MHVGLSNVRIRIYALSIEIHLKLGLIHDFMEHKRKYFNFVESVRETSNEINQDNTSKHALGMQIRSFSEHISDNPFEDTFPICFL